MNPLFMEYISICSLKGKDQKAKMLLAVVMSGRRIFTALFPLSILSELSVMSLYFGNKGKSYCFKFTDRVNLFSPNSFNLKKKKKSSTCSLPKK